MKTLFCVIILPGLFNLITSNRDSFQNLSPKERPSLYGIEDGSIVDCHVGELVRPTRSKKSSISIIHIAFNASGNFLMMTLKAVQDDHLISRSRTGIWAAYHQLNAFQKVLYSPWPEAFDVIGNFKLYQNVEEGSAVAVFWDAHGNEHIIGTLLKRYIVKSPPKEFDYLLTNFDLKGTASKRSVNPANGQDKKRSFLTICKDDGFPQEYFHYHTYTRNDALTDPNLHRVRRQNKNRFVVPDVVYQKLLVIPDFSTIERYRYHRDFMMQLIGQLNFVDLMFRQLKNPEVHLSIAGIIIPSENGTTPYMSKHIDADNRIDGEAAVHEADVNFRYEKRRFPHNKWDAILMLTANTIRSHNGVVEDLNGFSPLARGCAGAAAIARFTENMKGIYTLVHELGHMLGAKHDEDEVAAGTCTNATGDLMATNYSYSQSVGWSNCSRAAFQTYFQSYKGICTYEEPLKIPNAMKSMPGAWLPIAGQCDNLFYDSRGYCMFETTHDCSMYGCNRNNTCVWIFSSPLEGSSFRDNNGTWVRDFKSESVKNIAEKILLTPFCRVSS